MNNSYPCKLQLLSLSLSEPLEQDISCSINLIKGTHHYGQVFFTVLKDQKEIKFETFRIINFYYMPRMANRRDVFFRMILNDLDTDEEIGEIQISTNLLFETFSKNKSEVIRRKEEITDGVLLEYEIYQPKIDVVRPNEKIGFKKVQADDFLNSLFARPETKHVRRKSPPPFNPISPGQAFFEIKPKNNLNGPESNPKPNFNLFDMLINKKSSTEQKPVENNGSELNQNLGSDLRLDHRNISNTSSMSEEADNLMEGVLSFLKESKSEEIKKKLTLMPSVGEHNSQKGLSKKLKAVLFLLLFGFLLLVVDTLNDKDDMKGHEEVKVKIEASKPAKKKKKKNKEL